MIFELFKQCLQSHASISGISFLRCDRIIIQKRPILLRINQIDCQSCEFIFVDHGKHLHLSICYQVFHYMQGLFLLFRKCFIIQIIKLPFIFCAFIGNVYKFHFFSPA